MQRVILVTVAILLSAYVAAAPPAKTQQTSWPMFGGSPSRNMVNLVDRDAPDDWDVATKRNIKWVANLGSRSYSQPVVADGRVFIGTNNENPRNKRDRGKPTEDDPDGPPLDKGIMMCLRESDGALLWQAVHDKLPRGQLSDWPREGVVSTPCVVGDRVYYVSNDAKVICSDVQGFANGNDGWQGEKYCDPTDADIVWQVDLIKEYDVSPHNICASSPTVVGETLFLVTSNGVADNHIEVENPDAPSFVALDRKTGKLLWKDNSPGKDILHGQWSSPAYAAIPVPQVIFPGGDGWLRAFETATGKLLWKFDGNRKGAEYEVGGKGEKNDYIGTPVVAEGRLYIGMGQDPEHFEGLGRFWCIDLKQAVEKGRVNKDRDVSPRDQTFDPAAAVNKDSAFVWHYGGHERRRHAKRDFVFSRTLGTTCVVDGVVYIPTIEGMVHCLDAQTGRRNWVLDTRTAIWGSAYYVDGKVFVGNEDGDMYVLRHLVKPFVLDETEEAAKAPTKEAAAVRLAEVRRAVREAVLIRKIEMEQPFRSTPAVANGVLYVSSERQLFAIQRK